MQNVAETEDEFAEEPLTQNGRQLELQAFIVFRTPKHILCDTGEIVLLIARGVGFVVAIVAILLCFMFMMIARAFLSFLLYRVGVTGVLLLVALAVWGAMRLRNMTFKIIWTIFSNSCS